jgi:hypothetical protein
MTEPKTSYEMAKNPPSPMPWEGYESRLKRAWEEVLNSDCAESEVHRFLEQHPCLLPGPFSMSGESGHFPFPDAVVSKPPLLGIGRREPDFMWLATDSMFFEPVLIEIERPNKRWFTSKGVPSADLTQAQNQLAQWRAWFTEPANVGVFHKSFDIPEQFQRRTLRVSCVLIYGRRHECERKHHLNKIRAQLAREGEYLMSFDRLNPNPKARYLYTVRRQTDGYEAIAFPPTYVLGPGFAEEYLAVRGKEEAVAKSSWISQSRRDFIGKRFSYWENWERNHTFGLVRSEVE